MQSVTLTELFILLSLTLIQYFFPSLPPFVTSDKTDVLPSSSIRSPAFVTNVVDGDTLTVEVDGKVEKVRLIGIDTPETVDPRREVECFGREASEAMKKLVLQKDVSLENDPTQSDRDRYQRLLRYVYLPGDIFVNEKMIQEGFAFEYTYDKPYRYQKNFKQAEKTAKSEERGLWREGVCTEK